jgi:hypothetical protein
MLISSPSFFHNTLRTEIAATINSISQVIGATVSLTIRFVEVSGYRFKSKWIRH